VGPRAGVVATKKINTLAPQGCEPGTDQSVALSASRKQMNKHIRAGEISHTCGIWDDSNHELARRFKFRCSTGMFLLAKGRNCYCRSVVGCVRHTTKCGLLSHLNWYVLYSVYIHIYKSKAVPLQAWSGPQGSRKLRFPDCMTTAQDGGKVVSLTHQPPLPPGNAPAPHFC